MGTSVIWWGENTSSSVQIECELDAAPEVIVDQKTTEKFSDPSEGGKGRGEIQQLEGELRHRIELGLPMFWVLMCNLGHIPCLFYPFSTTFLSSLPLCLSACVKLHSLYIFYYPVFNLMKWPQWCKYTNCSLCFLSRYIYIHTVHCINTTNKLFREVNCYFKWCHNNYASTKLSRFVLYMGSKNVSNK